MPGYRLRHRDDLPAKIGEPPAQLEVLPEAEEVLGEGARVEATVVADAAVVYA